MSITQRIDNITHIPDAYKSPRPPCPKSVKIELTGRCNYRCGFCALRMRDCQPKVSDDMDLGFFMRIVSQMHKAGVDEIGLFYLGESLMAPELTIEACRFAKSLGIPYVFLTTNGSLANDKVLYELMDAGLDSLKFSLNAYSFGQFQRVMGVKPKLYKKALRNLKRAYDIRNLNGFDTKIYASSIQYDGEQAQRMERIAREQIEPFVDEFYYLPLYSMGSVATQREKELGYRQRAIRDASAA